MSVMTSNDGPGSSPQFAAPATEQLVAALDLMADGLVVVRKDGVIVYVSRPVCVLFGYEPHELVGQRIDVLVPEPRRAQHRRDCARFATTGASRAMGRSDLDIVGRHRNGRSIPIDVQLAPVAGDMVAATVRDVTGARQEAADRALRRLDRDVSNDHVVGLLAANELALQELFALAARLGAQASRASSDARTQLSDAVATVDDVIERVRAARSYGDGARRSDV
jgi:PAS domain S-box-containing protein